MILYISIYKEIDVSINLYIDICFYNHFFKQSPDVTPPYRCFIRVGFVFCFCGGCVILE